MPAHTDHIRRDAQHAARSDIMVEITKYVRRVNEAAKAHIDEALATSEGVIDGTRLGREAAQAAVTAYIGTADIHDTIEAGAPAIETFSGS